MGTQSSFHLRVTFQSSCTHTQVPLGVQLGWEVSLGPAALPAGLAPPLGNVAGRQAWAHGGAGSAKDTSRRPLLLYLFCLLTEMTIGSRPETP